MADHDLQATADEARLHTLIMGALALTSGDVRDTAILLYMAAKVTILSQISGAAQSDEIMDEADARLSGVRVHVLRSLQHDETPQRPMAPMPKEKM